MGPAFRFLRPPVIVSVPVQKWSNQVFDQAQMMASFSPDPSTKVGALVVGPSEIICGTGWNSFPRGIPESWWHNRPLKYLAVVHAEAAALLQAGTAARGGAIFSTAHPCRECAKLIAAAGIVRVVAPRKPWRDDPAVNETCADAATLFQACGITHEEP